MSQVGVSVRVLALLRYESVLCEKLDIGID